jgi:dihydrofolate reductase
VDALPGLPYAPSMSRLRLYIAATLDGFIADVNGGVGWLDAYGPANCGYDAFLSSISSIIMGRVTYQQVLGFGTWPYAGKRTVVMTSRTNLPVHPEVEVCRDEVRILIDRLRAETPGDIWLMGGGKTLRGFLDRDLVDELDLFVFPLLLGRGIRLFDGSSRPMSLRLAGHHAYPSGAVRLLYHRAPPDAANADGS